MALAHGSADEASANAEALEETLTAGTQVPTGQDWSEVVELEGVEVVGDDDRVALARLRPRDGMGGRLWVDLLFQRDPLVSYC